MEFFQLLLLLQVVRDKAVIKPAPGKRDCKCKMRLETKQLGPGMFQQFQKQASCCSSSWSDDEQAINNNIFRLLAGLRKVRECQAGTRERDIDSACRAWNGGWSGVAYCEGGCGLVYVFLTLLPHRLLPAAHLVLRGGRADS